MTKESFLEGKVLLIDKPLNWTSFQAVNKIRWHIKQRFKIKKIKVGHAGTLDPLATGLLIICCGKETKNINTYQGQIKEYTGTFTIGATTPSYDLETEVNRRFNYNHLTTQQLKDISKLFVGTIQQTPPIFSAIKQNGTRLYEHARKGHEIEVNTRQVTIHNFELTKIDMPHVDFIISCSKGTYIRSIAHDFGKALQNGGYLSRLQRTKIGTYSLENALSLEDFEKLITQSS